jgi:hypothetical protein
MSGQAYVHRNGHVLSEHLAEALAAYQEDMGHLPPRITVHQSQVTAARAALSAGTNIVVEGLGGCLANEIWLWLSSDEEEEDK